MFVGEERFALPQRPPAGSGEPGGWSETEGPEAGRSWVAALAAVPERTAFEHDLLVELGYASGLIARAAADGRADGRGAAGQLIAVGRLDAERWCRTVSARLDLAWAGDIAPDWLTAGAVPPSADILRLARAAWIEADGEGRLLLAPVGPDLDRLVWLVRSDPDHRRRLLLTTPDRLRQALIARHGPALLRRAVDGLASGRPECSARRIGPGALAGVLALTGLIVALPVAAAFGAGVPMLAGAELAFMALGLLRLTAALAPGPVPSPAPPSEDRLPRYAVLVPLYREAGEVPRLFAALEALRYPRHLLQVLVLVEADDGPTAAAVAAHLPGTGFAMVTVPPVAPRTKPKALGYGLALADADLVTVYDAEDRPDPDQLRIAAAAFAAGPPDLVCVQAALAIDHAPASRPWIARQFALEYAALFDGLLPHLAAGGRFFPLGGTSNHFRRAALEAAGGWDPHNVTEDADIAVRLVRDGGRLGVIASSTREEAPLTIADWHGQRSRWLKGWLQTLAVHNRHPLRLLAELGPLDFLLFQLTMAGQFLSALVYPLSLGTLSFDALFRGQLLADRGFGGDLVLSACLIALALGMIGPVALAARVSRGAWSAARLFDLATMPVYWLLLWPAAVTALFELVVAPSRWTKTRHGLAERDLPLAERPTGRLSLDPRAGVAQG